MWKNIVQQGRAQMTIWRTPTNTHSEYVILIAFPLQQWLQERASLLRYTYIARLVCLWGCYVLPENQKDSSVK
jgi:hypothetical protein